MVTGGNWYQPPYPFFLAGGDTSSALPYWNVTDIVPGTVFPVGGAAPSAAFTGIDFTTYATTAAAFTPSGKGFPYYSSVFAPLTDNIWETGPAAAVSSSGNILIAATTNASNMSNPTLNPKNVLESISLRRRARLLFKSHARTCLQVEVVATAFPPKVLLADSWPDTTGLMFTKVG